MGKNTANEQFARQVQLQLAALGYYKGRIDGWAGSQTREAARRYMQETAVAVPSLLQAGSQQWPGPRHQQMVDFYGEPITDWMDERLVDVEPAYDMWFSFLQGVPVRRLRCHVLIAPSVGQFLQRIAEETTAEERKRFGLDQYGGCHDYRPQRGGTRLSDHAWAAAIDLAPDENPWKAEWPGPNASMPETIVVLAEQAGLTSYGRVKRIDAMHFAGVNLG